MGIFNFMDPVLDTIFGPLIRVNHFLAIILITFLVSLLMTIIYKYATDQKLMKNLKKRQKRLQKKMKDARNDPEKMMKIQKDLMALNSQYMKHSFRPMIFTFIPIIIIFGWLNMTFAYEAIHPGEDFTTTIKFRSGTNGTITLIAPDGITIKDSETKEITNKVEGSMFKREVPQANWTLSGEKGEYVLVYEKEDERYSKNVLITDGDEYIPVTKRKKTIIDNIYSSSDNFLPKDSSAYEIKVYTKPLKVLPFRFIKWDGWLVTYIIFSIIFSMVLRRIMGVS